METVILKLGPMSGNSVYSTLVRTRSASISVPLMSVCVGVFYKFDIISFLTIFAEPRSCVIQHIIIAVFHHAFRTKVNQHVTFNMPDNQEPGCILATTEAPVRNIVFIKAIAFLIIVFHRKQPDSLIEAVLKHVT